MAKRIRMIRELASLIKRMPATTDLYQHEIVARLGINQGRVSEVLSGKRFGDVKPTP